MQRERTCLATLLALHARQYVILETEASSRIVASHVSGNAPGAARVRWWIDIGPDASLMVDVADDLREMHKRVALWYDKLLANVVALQCRDVDWLRWEAQNQGLVPIGAYADHHAAATSGADRSAHAEAQVERRQVRSHPHAARISELENARAKLHYGRAFGFAGVGAAMAATGANLAIFGAFSWAQGCTEDASFYGGEDCSARETGRILLPVGAAITAVGGAMMGIGLTRGLRSFRRFREIGRELKLLRAAGLSFHHSRDARQGEAWKLSWQAHF